MTTNKPILIIKTGNTIPGLLAQGMDFEDWFRQAAGLEESQYRTVSLFLGEPLPSLAEVGAIIVTGSPAYVTDLEPWNHIGARYLLQAHDQAIPILGVCYGHQLLAWAFGGEVDHHPGGRCIGTVSVELNESGQADRLLGGLPASFPAQVSHRQVVLRLPPQATRLASNKFDPNHVFRLGETTWGIQFHPEFSVGTTRAYIRERRAVLEEEGLDPEQLLASLTETPEASSVLSRFVALGN